MEFILVVDWSNVKRGNVSLTINTHAGFQARGNGCFGRSPRALVPPPPEFKRCMYGHYSETFLVILFLYSSLHQLLLFGNRSFSKQETLN